MKIFSIIILLSLISCDMRNTPKCSDEKVKERTIQILTEKLKPKIIQSYSNVNFELLEAIPATAGPNDYFYTEEEYKKANSYAKKYLNDMELNDIITTNIFDSIKKCSCESHIEVEYLGKLLIQYSAQLTDEGKPFIKVNSINEE